MESILLSLAPAYPSAALVLCFLYPPNLFFLKVFVTTLPISVFYTMLFPSNRIWPLESSDKLSQVFSVLCRPFYEHKNAVLPEHQIVLFFKYICLKN